MLKLCFDPGLGRNSLDGDYYFQIARHVATGDGLQTSISLYHQGLRGMPQPTNAAPLWPLVLGAAGALVGVWPAALLLPELLYLVALGLLYPLANRLAEGVAGPEGPFLLSGGRVLDVGHAAVALLGLNPVFFEFTSLPYTEALAFALLFAGLSAALRAARHAGGAGLAWAAAAGLLAGAAFLARAQMIGLGLALVAGLALQDLLRRRLPRRALAATAAGLAAVAPWAAWLAGWARPFHPRVMLSLGAWRETPELAPFAFSMPVEGGLPGWIGDRLLGLAVAFDPWDGDSYFASFGPVALLVPLALLAVAARPGAIRRGLAALGRPRGAGVAVALAASVLLLVPVHLSHARFFKEWLFGFRHGLPLVVAVVLALPFLLAGGRRTVRALALLLVLASLLGGLFAVGQLLQADFASGLIGPEEELVAWLDAHPEPPAVVTTQAQTLAVYARTATFHWMECREEPEKTLALLDHAGADYVLAYAGEGRCPFLDVPEGALEEVRRFVAEPFPVAVYRRGTRR